MDLKIAKIPKQLVIFFTANALVSLFFGLILMGACLITLGLVWRNLEKDNQARANALSAAAEMQQERFALDLRKATADFERFREDFASKIRIAREELEQKVARFQLNQEENAAAQNSKIQNQLRELKDAYQQAKSELVQERNEALLKLKEARIEQQKIFDDAYRKFDSEFRKAAKTYESEAVKLGYVRQELEVLLDDVQKDLQALEHVTYQVGDLKGRVGSVERLVSARVKLTVFLADYRERSKTPIVPVIPLAPSDIEIPTNLLAKLTDFNVPETLVTGAVYEPLVPTLRIGDSLSGIQSIPLLGADAAAIPNLLPTVAEFAASQKLWLLPIVCGCMCLLLAFCLGYELLKNAKPQEA